MKALILTLATLISTTAFADARDLDIVSALVDGGASVESFMSQMHFGAGEIVCATTHGVAGLECTMDDLSANGGEGGPLMMTGQKAENLLKALGIVESPFDSSGVYHVNVQSVDCSQAMEGVMDGSDADRTNCSVTIGKK